MLVEERHQKILDMLSKQISIDVHALRNALAVSESTIRNDLRYLEEQNKLKRTHGGAVSLSKTTEVAYERRASIHIQEKKRIGQAAAQFIAPGDTIFLDAGSTVAELARSLPDEFEFIAVTHALNTASEAGLHSNVMVHMVGGLLRSSLQELVGPKAIEGIREIHAHKVFLGVSGIDFAKGLSENHIFSAEIKKAMIASSKEVIVLADSSKIGKVCFAELLHLDHVDVIITDKGISDEQLQQIQSLGVKVVMA